MEDKYKYSYLAFISEEEVIKNEVHIDEDGWAVSDKSDKAVSTRIDTYKHYANPRRKFFCKCGHSYVINKELFGQNYEITCDSCGTKQDRKDIVVMESRLFSNIINVRFRCFENEESIKLACFNEYVGLNIKSGKLYFISKRRDIIFNKKTNKFYLYSSYKKRGKLTSLSVHNLQDVLIRFFEKDINTYSKMCHNPSSLSTKIPRLIRDPKKDVIDSFEKFSNALLNHVNPKDKDRLSSYLEEIKLVDLVEKNSFGHREEFNAKYSGNLALIISCIQYSYMSTLIFSRGRDYFLSLLPKSPSIAWIKKRKPTSPKDIVRDMTIQNIDYRKKYYKRYSFSDKARIEMLSKKKKRYNKITLPNCVYKSSTNSFGLDFFTIYFNMISETTMTFDEFLKLSNIYGAENVIMSFYELYRNTREVTSIEFFSNERDFCRQEYFSEIFNHFLKIKEKTQVGRFNPRYYLDTLRFVENREERDVREDFLSLKTWAEIEELHDDIYRIVNFEKIEKHERSLKEFTKKYEHISENKIDNISFNLINTVLMLEKESKTMGHCVASYANGMSNGRHLIFSIIDENTGDRATLEFYNSGLNDFIKEDKWTFSQLKSKFNKKATDKIIDATIKFMETVLKDNKIKYELPQRFLENGDLSKSDGNSNEHNIQNIEFDAIPNLAHHDFEFANHGDDLPF
jgi:hypothetical protein